MISLCLSLDVVGVQTYAQLQAYWLTSSCEIIYKNTNAVCVCVYVWDYWQLL